MDRISAAEAVQQIRLLARSGDRVLGVDGFRVIPDGYVAALDLILDLSTRPISVEDAAIEAELFVAKHATENVLFEIVSEETGDSA